MTDSPTMPEYGHDESRGDLKAIVDAGPESASTAGAYRRLCDYLDLLESLKEAADRMVWEASHPSRRGNRGLNSIVAYRRIAEGGGTSPPQR